MPQQNASRIRRERSSEVLKAEKANENGNDMLKIVENITPFARSNAHDNFYFIVAVVTFAYFYNSEHLRLIEFRIFLFLH